MKRFIVLCALVILLLLPQGSRENPILMTWISELVIADSLNWAMELDSWDPDTLDDWTITTSAGTAGFRKGIILGGGIVTVTNADLSQPLALNPGSDQIRLQRPGSWPVHLLTYDSAGHAMVSAPKPGQSICAHLLTAPYYLDNSPTLGMPNDTLNATGSLLGKCMTSSGDPIAGVHIDYHSLSASITTDSAGEFAIADLAIIERLEFYHPSYTGTFVDVQIWPESTVTVSVQLDPIDFVDLDHEIGPAATFALSQNWPNPFNASTTVQISVEREELVVVDIYTVEGKLVTNLVSEVLPPGTHTVRWNAGDLPSALYLCRMTAGQVTASRKLLLLR